MSVRELFLHTSHVEAATEMEGEKGTGNLLLDFVSLEETKACCLGGQGSSPASQQYGLLTCSRL